MTKYYSGIPAVGPPFFAVRVCVRQAFRIDGSAEKIRHPPPVPPVDHHARKIAEVLPVRRTQLGHERPALAGIDGPVPDQELELQPQRIVAVHVEPLACHPNVPAELGPERSGTSGEGDEQRNEQKIEFPHADKSYL